MWGAKANLRFLLRPHDVPDQVSGSFRGVDGHELRRTDYDRGVNTFSPEGRLFQVEYAIEAIKMGTTAVGIRTTEGVVLAVEKRITSPLLEPSSIEKIMEVDSHIGAAMSGLTADARTLIDHARVEATNHWFSYNERIRVNALTQAVCDLALSFGEGSDENNHKQKMSRPFGVALLIAGVDDSGPHLFYSDPSGTYLRVHAKAIGSGQQGAQNNLKESYNENMSLADAQKLAIGTLKQHMEEKLSSINVELAVVTAEHGFHVCTIEELDAVIARFDLGRARETAAIIANALQLSVVFDATLREEQYGVLEGHTASEIQADPSLQQAWHDRKAGKADIATESRDAFYARTALGLQRVAHGRGPTDRILVVTHGGFIINCYRYVHGLAPGHPVVRLKLCPHIGNTSVSIVEGSGTEWKKTAKWGSTPHMEAATTDDKELAGHSALVG
ncbi:proteasome subunit alpha type-5 [Achlya hypogyna]|uniref:Proteasome subunit alpha type-5 n=1 Tax=Achlya hypogyna TaxID=1202772 RepID=A0A1V9YRC4_ACHHY|nr:proteasome subunit alpha type-5 [Achlya hypogyna]